MAAQRDMNTRGHYSVMGYRPDPVRDESRNVAVLYVDESGEFSGVRAIPPHRVSTTVVEHGVLDAILLDLERRTRQGSVRQLGSADLRRLSEAFSHSVVFSRPRPAVGHDGPLRLLDTLYAALVAPKGRQAVGFTKGHVVTVVTKWLRTRGVDVRIGGYVDDFLFDVVAAGTQGGRLGMHVVSLAAKHVESDRVQRDLGHFLFAAGHVKADCLGIVQPAPAGAVAETRRLQELVYRWSDDANVTLVSTRALKRADLDSDAGGVGWLASLRREQVLSSLH